MTHVRAISRTLGYAATVLAALTAAACTDLVAPESVVAGADLLPLPLKSSAPAPGSLTFAVANDAVTERRIVLNDGFNTTYLLLRFPRGSLADLNGMPIAGDGSVTVAVDPVRGGFGFALSPTALTFVPGNEPTVTIGIEPWGDFTVGPANGAYATTTAYKDALEVWREVGVDRWRVAPGSGLIGTSDIGATVEASGTYQVAALR